MYNKKESKEDYLERILQLEKTKGSFRAIDLAKSMNFSKPSVSVALKKLKEDGYISIEENGLIRLNDSGRKIAEYTLEKHECLTGYFISIGVDPKIANDDACKIEHLLSEETFIAIKKALKK